MKLSRVTKNLILFICVAAVAFFIVGGVIYRSIEALYFAIGVVLTSSLNIGRLCLLERTVQKTLDIEDVNSGKNYVRLQFLLRYVLTGVVLMAAGLISVYVEPPFINIWGAIAGIFTLHISIFLVKFRKLDDEK